MIIYGCVGFKNKLERRKRIFELKCEYGDSLRIRIENRLIMYNSYVKVNY